MPDRTGGLPPLELLLEELLEELLDELAAVRRPDTAGDSVTTPLVVFLIQYQYCVPATAVVSL